ncbi:uncharacterized protein PGTG_14230 [Puccinia graminis f. sp. tritici CRL 75-36-700-3]|uniref:Rho-GAP domain-containing protein n=1 Tax=Puccinia graminis f. sp. tritici (strain CRL 75-36-700-3 / race SCCL) TaxID=418459 RepID=E3KWZ8_PUCGT|nr:uncharacterized protein PGTG_14230 [Puccinia graminis f. sp. tritici CRL 75-36-700-3]EFP88891.2 hypothetical protein PGTG_14230 [Puccinia graminis f. sp. tritici CRL 75-36-700-3]
MKWVASFSHLDEETGSKMDLQNLATVITPNILKPTLLLGETPPNKRVFIPDRQEESLPASWIVYQIAGRDSSRQAGGQATLLTTDH